MRLIGHVEQYIGANCIKRASAIVHLDKDIIRRSILSNVGLHGYEELYIAESQKLKEGKTLVYMVGEPLVTDNDRLHHFGTKDTLLYVRKKNWYEF